MDLERVLELRYLYNCRLADDAYWQYVTVKPRQKKIYHLHYRYILNAIYFDRKLQEYRCKKYDYPQLNKKPMQITLF